MPEPVWIEIEVVLAIHDEQLAGHGGLPGVHHAGPLEFSLGQPRHQLAYDVVAELFLERNGYSLTASDAQCVTTFLQFAAGDLTDDQLEEWLAVNSAVLT